jgi:uncharacterized protein with beta-barrel porin domain
MKRQPAYRHCIDRVEIATSQSSAASGRSAASASTPGSGKLALRSGWMLRGVACTAGTVAALLCTAPSESQQTGSLTNSSSQNAAQSSMATSILTFCPKISGSSNAETAALSTICTGMVQNPATNGYQLSQQDLNAATQTLNGEEVQAMQQQVVDVRAMQVANITARIEAIRHGSAARGLRFAGLTLDGGKQILPAGYGNHAVAGEGDSLVGDGGTLSAPTWDKLGVFTTLGGSLGDKGKTGEVTGYDFYTVGLTTGADYRVRNDLALGSAVGYSYYNADFDKDLNNPSGQGLDSSSVIFSFFGTYFPNNRSLIPLDGLFLDGMASFGWSFFDMSRHVFVPNTENPALPNVNAHANSDTTAFQYGFASDLGYEFNIGAFTITPVSRVQYVKADVSSYEESGASPLNLKVGSQDATSLTTNAGLSLGYTVSTQYGVLEPTIRAEYVHEFENDDNGAKIRYIADPTATSAFNIITENPNRNYGIVGAALTGTLAGGWSAFTDFETVVGMGNFDIYTLRAGFRKTF